MRTRIRLIGLAAIVAASVSCGDVVRQGSSPVFLVIDSLSPIGASTKDPGPLSSDVVSIAPAPCTAQAPCTTSDVGSAVLSLASKDIGLAPTSNNDVTIDRYHVEYTRTDGCNTAGVDVPYAFDGAITGTIKGAAPLTIAFTLVRSVAKQEAPLAQLRTGANIVTTIANVTFYGVDRTGNAISVTGKIQIDFGNFPDKTT